MLFAPAICGQLRKLPDDSAISRQLATMKPPKLVVQSYNRPLWELDNLHLMAKIGLIPSSKNGVLEWVVISDEFYTPLPH